MHRRRTARHNAMHFLLSLTYSTTCYICRMPPKRPLSDTNSYQSPPPGHRAPHGNDHHHSPIPGHHQETPADAAVAITTPPRNNIRNVDANLLPTSGISLPASAVTGEIHEVAANTAIQRSPQAEMQPVAVVSGGARAAYQAAQQQRTITCNLANIPPSK